MINMLIIRNRFAALTQRIKNSQTFKIDFENKFQNDRDSNLKFRLKSTKQHNHKNDTTINQLN